MRRGAQTKDQAIRNFRGRVLLLALAFAGFSAFYLHGKAYPDREIAPPIRMIAAKINCRGSYAG